MQEEKKEQNRFVLFFGNQKIIFDVFKGLNTLYILSNNQSYSSLATVLSANKLFSVQKKKFFFSNRKSQQTLVSSA